MTARRVLLCAGVMLALGACDGEMPPEDPDSGVDLELPEAEAFVEASMEFQPATLDLSCLGTRTQPEAGEPVDATFELRDFQDEFEVPEVEVWLFSNNEIADTCDGPACQSFTTDSMGNGSISVPANGWYAYRVLPKEGPTRGTTVFGVFQYNEPAPATSGQSVQGQSVSGSTVDLIPALLGIPREPGRAIVAGTVQDCNEANVANAVIRIFDPDGNFIEEGTRTEDPHYHYFNGNADNNLPDQSATYTAADGLYVAPQIPVADDRPYRVEAWATVDGELTRISCESARIFGDAVTILNVGPLRADAPASCE